jgi:hypothetical protein
VLRVSRHTQIVHKRQVALQADFDNEAKVPRYTPYEAWCQCCVKAKARSDQFRSSTSEGFANECQDVLSADVDKKVESISSSI